MQQLKILMIIALTVLLGSALDSSANSINVGVPDTGLKARDLRDGASGITFIDLDSKVSGNGWITSWSIYAQQFVDGWWNNNEARWVALYFFRDTGSNYQVIGKSPLETVPAGRWDEIYTFNLATPIQVQQNDYLGFYYPFQGADSKDRGTGIPYFPNNLTPGGVIAFSYYPEDPNNPGNYGQGHNVRWHDDWGSTQGELALNELVPKDWFNSGPESEKKARVYSINATGTTTLTPLPSAALLLGSGLMALVGLRCKLKK